jgi:thimet oligopeptidase
MTQAEYLTDHTEEIIDIPAHYYDFNQLQPHDMEMLVSETTEWCKRKADDIAVVTEDTFWATAGASHDLDARLTHAARLASVLGNVHPDKAMRDAATEAKRQLLALDIDISYRDDVYQTIKRFAQSPAVADLSPEESRFLDKKMRNYRKSGMDLAPEQRERMKALQERESNNVLTFVKNINDDDTKMRFKPEQLTGMDDTFLANLEKEADGTYVVSMKYPEYFPIMDRCAVRATRQKLSETYSSRLMDTNIPILEDTIAIRQEMAAMSGYPSWAHFKLEEKMAKTPDAVKKLYAELTPPLREKARQETAVMQAMLQADGHDGVLHRYDTGYYEAQLAKSQHKVDREKINQYFPVEDTLQGLFELTGSVYGLQYREIDLPTWHDDVRSFAVDDAETGTQIATFYLDLFPREGKYGHACASPLVLGGHNIDGRSREPSSVMVANFSRPSLRHDEVTTLFHEFGHILHQTLSKNQLALLSGTSVERDFVEAPSQINENWTWDISILRRFAKHYQTGEQLPEELLDGLIASRDLNIAINTLTQITFGSYDMSLYDESPTKDVRALWDEALKITDFPNDTASFRPATIMHFMRTYDAGYYGYLWSLVFGDDMYGRFADEGVDNPSVGKAYRQEILEKGGTVDAMDMLRAFLGREPNNAVFCVN